MKAKNQCKHRHPNRRGDALPHELGAHLFATIKRNLLTRRQERSLATATQLTFAL